MVVIVPVCSHFQTIDARLTVFKPLLKLSGRLDLVLSQVAQRGAGHNQPGTSLLAQKVVHAGNTAVMMLCWDFCFAFALCAWGCLAIYNTNAACAHSVLFARSPSQAHVAFATCPFSHPVVTIAYNG